MAGPYRSLCAVTGHCVLWLVPIGHCAVAGPNRSLCAVAGPYRSLCAVVGPYWSQPGCLMQLVDQQLIALQ